MLENAGKQMFKKKTNRSCGVYGKFSCGKKKTEQNPRVDIGCARVLGTFWMQRSSQQWSAVEWGGRTDS